MSDPRMLRLAKLLVQLLSFPSKKGDWVHIRGEMSTEPLVRAVVEEVVKAGGQALHPAHQ